MNDILKLGYVPRISKAQFDDEATEFLQKYWPDALTTPSAVPIEHIAKKKMGLRIHEHRLTEDFSVLGMMCFTTGLAEIYNKENDEYREIKVRYGTMIIDPDTLAKRNVGCLHNTMAHEALHWHKHRNYHILNAVQPIEKFVCPADEPDESQQGRWSDEDWMEWQARGIAPRILMPIQTVKTVFDRLLDKSQENAFIKAGLMPPDKWLIEQMAAFYSVSKQAAEIRMSELGLIR
ncbi:MAG: ImmA/IrrE family metallo-endopeptidase [Coriobacteriales bacterium]|jgi:hypothetical protein|nr:ImmA/IrrE family metallo-endopeptidase [Coriobacteriales bacterium]